MNHADIWSHPRIKHFAAESLRDYEAMATVAAKALADRRATYPKFVEAGKLDAAQAEADLSAWEAIAADWQWIANPSTVRPEPVEGLPIEGRRSQMLRAAALDTAIQRFFTLADKAANGKPLTLPEAQQQQITSLLAMRWHAEFERELRYTTDGHVRLGARSLAKLNQQLRSQSAQEERKAA